MDNISHTLIGVLVAETAATLFRSRRAILPPAALRASGVAVMALGSNLPDADFVYSAITGNPLDYLLQHRGYTHTLAGALLIALALFVAVVTVLRLRRLRAATPELLYLGGLALLAPLLHIAMDYSNSYGVHPFWPFDNAWFYGDAVFIVEPLLWIAAAPLFFVWRARPARWVLALTLAGAVVLSLRSGLVTPLCSGILAALTLALLAVGRYARPRIALLTALAVWIGATVIFFSAGAVAARRIDAVLAQGAPQAAILDRALSPLPVNPVCWDVLTAQLQGDLYTVRKGALSLMPSWIAADKCPSLGAGRATTAPLIRSSLADSPAVHWSGELRLSRDYIVRLAATSCEAAALLRFARIPVAYERNSTTLIGDLRFDREPGLGLSEIEIGAPAARCATSLPPWLPPRGDLLRGR